MEWIFFCTFLLTFHSKYDSQSVKHGLGVYHFDNYPAAHCAAFYEFQGEALPLADS